MKITIETSKDRDDYSVIRENIESPRDTVVMLIDALVDEAVDNCVDDADEDEIRHMLFGLIGEGVHEALKCK